MRKRFDLGELDWTVAGWTPFIWRLQRTIESGVSNNAEIPAIPARVPGSVQGALLEAGLLPDWNVGVNARLCEWVENRHWIFTARLPEEWIGGRSVRLRALGLDYAGWVLLNGREVGRFRGSLVPHLIDLTPHLRAGEHTLQIVFDTPPRWLGQIGYTSEMTEWKERFNYFWDWTARLVQIGIWDNVFLDVSDGDEIEMLDCRTRAAVDGESATLRLGGTVSGSRGAKVMVQLSQGAEVLLDEEISIESFLSGISRDVAARRWWPNGHGDQPLYELRVQMLDSRGNVLDGATRRVGFRALTWQSNPGAPDGADPWLCVVNGRPIFLQGVNWTPIRPNFADVTDQHYRALLTEYRDMGCTMLRVWGGSFLEKEIFYELCDELGILVWQEFPLSSSGLDNWPPDDPASLDEMETIARSYVERRRHHVSLAVWCGGNELTSLEHRPVDVGHPMLRRLRAVVERYDPDRRFLPTSPSGPRFSAETERVGRGEHWDVHGPWHVTGSVEGDWARFWSENDGLFHSEVGVASTSSAELIRRYRGDLPDLPGTTANPLWRRTSWWIDWPVFVQELGREPQSLEEFVEWSQERQRRALEFAVRTTRAKFPRCGGILLWMGHDSFPCTANTAIIDFDGKPKPAAVTVGEIFRAGSET